jgi:CRP-like cAMP-binding protein
VTSLDIFRHTAEFKTFRASEVIFEEGQIGDAMYVVQEGQVEIRRGGQVLDRHGPGGVFGEMAIIERAPRSASAVAATDCKVVPIDERRFLYLIQHTPFFAIQIMRVMSERLRRMIAMQQS